MGGIKTALGLLAAALLVAACTPSYTGQTSVGLARQAGLADDVVIARGNQRLLSRQGQVCLLSDQAGSDAGKAVLRTMQSAFTGYFVAVGMESEPMDYPQALAAAPCPGASYLLFVQSQGNGCADKPDGCGMAGRASFVITIVNRGDQSLLDRVEFSVKNSWLPFVGGGNQERLHGAFERLAAALVGTPSR